MPMTIRTLQHKDYLWHATVYVSCLFKEISWCWCSSSKYFHTFFIQNFSPK